MATPTNCMPFLAAAPCRAPHAFPPGVVYALQWFNWLFLILLSRLVVLAVLIADLTGLWVPGLVLLHLVILYLLLGVVLRPSRKDAVWSRRYSLLMGFHAVVCVLDIAICVGLRLLMTLFIDLDGSVNRAWRPTYQQVNTVMAFGWTSIAMQLTMFALALVTRCRRAPRPAADALPLNVPLAALPEAAAAAGAPAPLSVPLEPAPGPKQPVLRKGLFATLLLGLLALAVPEAVALLAGSFGASGYAHCEPLGQALCMLPFPSAAFLRNDSTSPTGWRVAIDQSAMPIARRDFPVRAHVDPTHWNIMDGFSVAAPILFMFPDVAVSSLAGPTAIDQSLNVSSATTLLVDADSGELMPHFVEPDAVTTRDLLIMQPAVPLRFARRYVVAVRRLRSAQGELLPSPSTVFPDLRDGAAEPAATAALYSEHVWPALAAAGVDRSELQLAWFFVTASRPATVGAAESALGQLTAHTAAQPVQFTVYGRETYQCGAADVNIAANVFGNMEVPQLEPVWGAAAVAQQPFNNTVQVPFLLRIPCSVAFPPAPAPADAPILVQYGHGLFNYREEMFDSYLGKMANANRWLLIATDWTGLSKFDVLPALKLLAAEEGDFVRIPNQLIQSYANALAAFQLATSTLAQAPEVIFNGQSALLFNGQPLQRFAFYGNSLGSVLGGGYFALNAQLPRAVFGVAGSPFAFLVGRSNDFTAFLALLKFRFVHTPEIRVYLSLAQLLWDATESAGYLRDRLDRGAAPGRQEALVQAAYADEEVPRLGAEFIARGWRATYVAPAHEPIFNISVAAAPFNGSGLSEWVFQGVNAEPVDNTPVAAGKVKVHECLRREPTAQLQLAAFLATGTLQQFCDGPCSAPLPAKCQSDHVRH